MTIEEAIKVLRTESVELGGNAVSVARWLTALDMAVKALENVANKDAGRNEPLTLNELREMPIRDWVWIEILNPDAFRSKETVSAYYRKHDGYKKDEIFWCGYPGLGFRFFYEDYGKTWLAYRQKPEEDYHA